MECKDCDASENMESENEKVEVIVIKTENGKLFLMVGNERVEISDFTTRSSAHGETELLVTIKGKTVSTELSAQKEKSISGREESIREWCAAVEKEPHTVAHDKF